MSTEGYDEYDDGEGFVDEVEPGADDETVDALQAYIGEQVNATLNEHRAAEELMVRNPDLNVEELAQEVKAKAAALGAPELERNVAYWIQVAESQGAARPQDETAEQFFDREVLGGGGRLGADVLNFDTKG